MKVLIAIDQSECSSNAVDHLLSRAWPKEAEFRVITVIEPMYMGYPDALASAEPMLEAREWWLSECDKLLAKKSEQIRAKLPDHKVTALVLEGNVAGCIIDEARNWDADLLIVGSHGRQGMKKFMLGSVAEKVASHASCSVEIVKQKLPAAKETLKESTTAAAV